MGRALPGLGVGIRVTFTGKPYQHRSCQHHQLAVDGLKIDQGTWNIHRLYVVSACIKSFGYSNFLWAAG